MAALACRGVRGATTVDANTKDAILTETRRLLALMIRANDLRPDDIVSAVFSTTPDLDAEFPALAARQLGWHDVALLCTHEMAVPGALGRCVRILVHWNTERTAAEVVHVYVRGARNLRPDRASLPPVDVDELDKWITETAAASGIPIR